MHGRTTIRTDASTGALLATFTREPHSCLFVLHTVSHQVAESGQVAASGQVAGSCSCRSLAHPTVLWHHRLGHPSIPRLHSMASHRLVSGLLHVFASLPPSPAPSCTPCVAGRLRATPLSSLRPATAPFQTLHLAVWGPAPTQGPERERYFLVVVDDYSRYTMVFPLAKKSEVTSTLIRWLLATKGTRGSRVSCLHSDCGGEFCSSILRGFCGEQGISQSWTLPGSPHQNGVVERRIGLVMDIARLPVPPPPLFLTPSPPPTPAPPVPSPPPGPAPSGVSHATPLPSQQSSSKSPQQPSALPRQVHVDSGGVGAGGDASGCTRSGGALLRGACEDLGSSSEKRV
ncbi:unnamed protein product [Closterium sp. NIES-53]